MILRHHRKGDADSQALYSQDEVYRFSLTRRWSGGPQIAFVMLNPSTATEVANDPTIERCERRARMWGYGGVTIANLFAFRATRPADLKAAADPVGDGNDAVLRQVAAKADLCLCAWGAHGAHLGRAGQVTALLRGQCAVLHHLGLTLGGQPRHPLYLGYDRLPEVWKAMPPPSA